MAGLEGSAFSNAPRGVCVVRADSPTKYRIVPQNFKKALSCCHIKNFLQKCKKAVYNIKKRSHIF
jgi:hypothetical protein|nr:MAG TPA: hypothetical protein [Caudoviricetes sp.]